MPDAQKMDSTTYSFAAVAKILDLPESKLRYWAQVGFVGPSVKATGRMLFSFQDLVSVKAAKELVDRGFAVAAIRKALERVRAALPHVDRPLDRIRVAFDGEALVVVDEGNAFEVTGQKVFDFGLGDLARQAAITPMAAAATSRAGGRPDPPRPATSPPTTGSPKGCRPSWIRPASTRPRPVTARPSRSTTA